MMEMLLIVNAVRKIVFGRPIEATIPYVPYARQDRASNEGEANSIQIMAQLINMCDFARVHVWDAHSDVATALINNVDPVHVASLVPYELTKGKILIIPDAGAAKKLKFFANCHGMDYVMCGKTRDTMTGELSKISVDWCSLSNNDHKGRDMIIVDDICDGGRTFINLSKAFHESNSCGKLDLFTTHMIGSQGTQLLADHFDAVYTVNPFPKVAMDFNPFHPLANPNDVRPIMKLINSSILK